MEGHDATRLTREDGRAAAILQVVAHELKTPLTSLRAALQLLRRDAAEGPPERLQLLDVAWRGADRLSTIVQSFLDAVALAEGRLELKLASVSVRPLLERAAASASARHQRSDVAIAADEGLPAVRADEGRLLQVVEELLDNSLKCSPPGSGIEVAARRRGPDVEIAVADRGKGIPEAWREDVFRPFFQVDSSATRDVPGLGLGLATCRGLVERHGGVIRIEGRDGPGTVVTFTLPVAGDCHEEPQHVEEDHPVRG